MTLDVTADGFPALWSGYINDGRVEDVIALYADEAVLMPTFSPRSLRGGDGVRPYFEQLAAREALEVTLHTETVRSLCVQEDSHLVWGIYSFAFVIDGTRLTFPARFTFSIDLARDKPILHHHSSQIPRTLS
jgi:hypothetical protein